MATRRYCNCLYFLTIAITISAAHSQSTINVLTRAYDNQRTNANTAETILNTSNVHSKQFGQLFMLPVDDQVYAGVLYASGLQIAGVTHNVIFAATSNNSVYAFDADILGPPLWARNFNGPGRPLANTDPVGQACGTYTDFIGNIGIVGTPVIDGPTGTMYLVTRTVEKGNIVQRLHAVNLLNGNDQPSSPQVIQATVPGTGDGGTSDVFNPATQNQRPALALSNGIVYIAWSSYCDTTPYYGWVLAYNAATLAQVGAFNDAPNGSMNGIWMSGAGPAFDAEGNLYYPTGNGTFDGVTEFGESMVKLAPGSLKALDFFTPSDYDNLNMNDLDFGSGGPTILPGTDLLVNGGKDGKIYLLKLNHLGHEAAGDTQIPQSFQAVDPTIRPNTTDYIHNNNPVWMSPQGLNLYVWGDNDYLHAFRFNASSQKFTTEPAANGSVLPPSGEPGGMITVSANGSQHGSGILWATTPRNGDANAFTVPGNLYAFNAENLVLLWSSTGAGDDMLNFSKGSSEIVANGKVYVGSLSRFVAVYGLKGAASASQDLALNQMASGSAPCSSTQTPDKAFNGSASGGPNDKWCSSAANPWLMVDLGAPTTISRFVIEHAGAGGEDFGLNTAAFNIQISTDGVNFTTVVNVTGNADSITTHDIEPASARYVRLNITVPAQDGTPTANIYEFQIFDASGAILSPSDFVLSAAPSSQTTASGHGATSTLTVAPLNAFSGTVTLTASGLPKGATAALSPAAISASGDSTLSLTTTSSTPTGTYVVTIAATSGAIRHTTRVKLIVNAPSSAGTEVNLSSVFNLTGIVTDGTTFSPSGGLDQGGNAYSANLLGTTLSVQHLNFGLGPADAPNAVTSATVNLPSGKFSKLALLATGVNGNQTGQPFVVTYSDGTSTTFTQDLSDWAMPQGFNGESIAVFMPYRDQSNGQDRNPYQLYHYIFPLNHAKTVSNITLPNNSNVVVLAMTLAP